MKITKIRIEGKKPTEKQIEKICARLSDKFEWAGFITCVRSIFPAIKIGLHMKCFTVNTEKLGHNAYERYGRGWKKTSLPTWAQRVKFNHIVNDVLDEYGASANVKSGAFVVRDHIGGAFDEWAWREVAGSRSVFENRVFELTEAMIEDRRRERNQRAKDRRRERNQRAKDRRREEKSEKKEKEWSDDDARWTKNRGLYLCK